MDEGLPPETVGLPPESLERYVDGECSPEQARQILAALERDPALLRQAEDLRRLNALLRTHAGGIEAPLSLRQSVLEQLCGAEAGPDPKPRLRRRHLLLGAGGAVAAGLVAATLVPHIVGSGRTDLDVVDTFFRDFETYLLKDKAVDVIESRMSGLASWYDSRLSFSLPPLKARGDGLDLVGGRLCWLLERRLASLSYEAHDGPLVLYVMDAQGIRVPTGGTEPGLGESVSRHRSAGNSSVIWTSGRLLLVMVGIQQSSRLLSAARSLVG